MAVAKPYGSKMTESKRMEAELEYYKSRYEDLLSHIQNHSNLIGLPTLQGIAFVCVTEIVYCKGESSQTSVYLVDHKRHLVNRTLKDCEETLEKFGFCRIHKSYLINLQHIRKFNRGEGRSVDLSDGSHLEVTVSYKERLLSRVNKL